MGLIQKNNRFWLHIRMISLKSTEKCTNYNKWLKHALKKTRLLFEITKRKGILFLKSKIISCLLTAYMCLILKTVYCPVDAF